MKHGTSEEEMRSFYDRWEATVFTFSKLYLGDEACADAATGQAFLAYFESGAPLVEQRLPVALIRYVLHAAQQWIVVREGGPDATFEEMILALPDNERAVFLLHSALGVEFPRISAFNAMTCEEERRVWVNSLLHLQRQLRNDRASSLGYVCSAAMAQQAGTAQC